MTLLTFAFNCGLLNGIFGGLLGRNRSSHRSLFFVDISRAAVAVGFTAFHRIKLDLSDTLLDFREGCLQTPMSTKDEC